MQYLPEGERIRVHKKHYGVKVGSDINLVLLGRRDYTALVEHVAAAFIADIQDKCYTAMYGAADKLPNPEMFNKGGELGPDTKLAFDTLIEDVSTANRAEVVIMGTKMALKKLTALADVDWADEGTKKDVMTLGRLGSYESTSLIEIPQRFKLNDVTADKLYSNDLLFIFAIPAEADKFIKFVDKGESEILETGEKKGDHADDFQKYELQRSYGVGVMLGRYFGVWNTDASAVDDDAQGDTP